MSAASKAVSSLVTLAHAHSTRTRVYSYKDAIVENFFSNLFNLIILACYAGDF